MIDQAFVLGAGLGLRLRPLTEDLPKPLVPIFQKPLITFALDHLAAAGVKSFVVNTHHLSRSISKPFSPTADIASFPLGWCTSRSCSKPAAESRMRNRWLGTKPFIAYSGDVLTDLPLEPLLEEHFASGNDVTLALRETGLASNIAFRDGDGRVIDIGNRYGHPGNFDYANISVWNPQIFERIPSDTKVSFIPVLAEWIGAGRQDRWRRFAGRPLVESRLARRISRGPSHVGEETWRPDYVQPSAWPIRIAPDASVDPSAQVRGCSSIGAGCRVGAGAIVEDSILWPGAQIASRSRLQSLYRPHPAQRRGLADRCCYLDWPSRRMNQAATKSKMRPGFQSRKAGRETRSNSFSCLESPAVAARPLQACFLHYFIFSCFFLFAFPMILAETLLQQTRLRFPGLEETEASISPIEKGGSERKFIASSFHLVSRSSSSNTPTGTPKMSAMSVSRSSWPPTVCARRRYSFTIRRKASSGSRISASATFGATATKAGRCAAAFYESALEEIAKLHRVSAADSAEIRD